MAKITNLQEISQRNLKITTIIQARMGSKRFPGKSTALLKGKPVIQWCIERAKLIKQPKNVKAPIKTVIAVPDKHENEPILIIGDMLGIDNFMGDEKDVLKRYYDAAKFFHSDIIVRITGDCPFIDPVVASEVIALLVWRRLDYCSNIFPTRSYPQGLDIEAFTFDALEAAHVMARKDYDREHVTPWMQNTLDIKRACVAQKINKSDLNWCVDYPEDIERLEKEITLNNIIMYAQKPRLVQ